MIILGEHVSDCIASCIAELQFDIAYMFFSRGPRSVLVMALYSKVPTDT